MASFQSLDGAVVSFLNYGTGTAIDLTKGGKQDGTPVIGYEYHGGENQKWKLQKVDKSTVWPTFTIRNVQADTNLDLYQGGKEDGTKITGWAGPATENINSHQLWYFVTADDAGTVFMIQNVGTGTFVDLLNGNAANSTEISGWGGYVQNKNPHQLWRVVRH
ncbi:carbohydrate-binding module family 13 protein [Annulohypoxylon maeteangense]|uniref:carbohydrate-binding module family 13 protein n=1 Tax=Annulohypoxylon maeteangense TaxID=1927788 RepID=UPI0020074BD5|nr:carbohydrate-binding module family 13 protein [Annulohypoxylon maeteangense]KAI0884122.1 carbohydrate-binding module family 13 protein [Annulohypoxylon maeteangense]